MRFLRDESGQAVVMIALALAVIVGIAALAVDVGQLRYQKRNLQAAADAAALAAGMEIRTCGATPNCTAMQAAAQSALTENGLTGSTLIANCGSTPGTGLTIEVNDPPCALGGSDPNAGNNRYAEVVVSQRQQTYFARVLGINSMQISTRAEAERDPHAPCVYSLDPTGAGAISILIGLGIRANCGIVDESNNSAALACLVGLLISSPRITVTGGAAGLLCTSTPEPRTGVPVPVPNDPLANLLAPSTAGNACGTSTNSPYTGSPAAVNILTGLLSPIVFNPGVYCGGISITAGLLTNITFNPGTYILKSGPASIVLGIPLGHSAGGLSITLSVASTISGQGVTFYNEGGALSVTVPSIAGLSGFNLSAPTTGAYAGILFWQPSSNTTAGSFIASLLAGNNFQGAVYLPGASVTYGVSALSSAYNIVVAKDVNFGVLTVLSTFGSNFSSLPQGSPLEDDYAVLVQ